MDESYRNLWAAVLIQAIEDVERFNRGFDAENAMLWFKNENEEAGSFRWVCSALDLDPELIKLRVLLKKNNTIPDSKIQLPSAKTGAFGIQGLNRSRDRVKTPLSLLSNPNFQETLRSLAHK